MQADSGSPFLRFNADVIPKFDAQKRLQEAFNRNVIMNETRTILLRYKHTNATSDSNARLLAESSSYNLPSLLQSQTRIKPTFKGPTPMKKDMRVDMTNPFTIMSYRPERSDNIDSRKPIIKGQNLNRKGKAPQKTVVASNQTRWKARTGTLQNDEDYPDPLLKADKSFLARITELSQLELETVKFEKTRKLKRRKFPEL